MRKFTLKNQQGFSLIETLIAVTILMIAIAGPLALVQAGLFSANHNRNQVTATYLAQEAIEFVKNVRDSNSYDSTNGWLYDNKDDAGDLLSLCSSGGCYVDPHQTLNGRFVQSYDGPKMLQLTNIGNGFEYDYDTTKNGAVTSFNRVVTITPIGDGSNEVTVTVKMTWKDNSLERNYSISTNLYNYQNAKAVAVSPSPSAPTVSITSPVDNTTVSGAAVVILARATDNVGVTKVEFYKNGALVSSVSAAPFSITWNPSLESSGTYVWTAKAYNAAGKVGTSNAVNLIVAAVVLPPAPTISLTTSANNIVFGNSATLTWASTNTTACSATADQTSIQWAGPLALSSAVGISVNPTVTTKYTITCTGSNLTTISDSKTVTVTPPPSSTIIGYMHPGYCLSAGVSTPSNVTTPIYNTPIGSLQEYIAGSRQKYLVDFNSGCGYRWLELLPNSVGYSVDIWPNGPVDINLNSMPLDWFKNNSGMGVSVSKN